MGVDRYFNLDVIAANVLQLDIYSYVHLLMIYPVRVATSMAVQR